MPETKIDNVDWWTITTRIRAGLCVPFLGAGANVKSEKDDYEGLMLGSELALHMIGKITGKNIDDIKLDLKQAEQIDVIKKLIESPQYKGLARLALQDLTRVALHLKDRLDFAGFMGLLKQFLPDTDRAPSQLLNTLARIPKLSLIVTTNYDRLMEKALQDAGERAEVIVQRLRGFTDAEQREVEEQMDQPDVRVIYKMHGTFLEEEELSTKNQVGGQNGNNANGGNNQDRISGEAKKTDLASQLIISEDDYIQFLTVIGRPTEGVPPGIKTTITVSTLLFLGYALEDWDFRTIHKGLIETLPPQDRRQSFAIQKDPSDLLVSFWEKRGVRVFNMDMYEFAGHLKEQCQKAGLYKEPDLPAAQE